MFVATKLAKIKAASLFVASPSAYARAAVAAIGYEVSHIATIFIILVQFNFLHFIFYLFFLLTEVHFPLLLFTSPLLILLKFISLQLP